MKLILSPITSVISHIRSITAPLSNTCTTYRRVVLIKKQLTSAVEKWTNASCHTSDSRVKECKWTSDQLIIQSSLFCNFPLLRSPTLLALLRIIKLTVLIVSRIKCRIGSNIGWALFTLLPIITVDPYWQIQISLLFDPKWLHKAPSISKMWSQCKV